MLLPTIGISADRALLTVGAQVLLQLDRPMSVGDTWFALRQWRERNGSKGYVSFDWFVLALDILYALGAIRLEDDLLVKQDARTLDADPALAGS
jgi:hypothetical protein